jgi:hypothetical protein
MSRGSSASPIHTFENVCKSISHLLLSPEFVVQCKKLSGKGAVTLSRTFSLRAVALAFTPAAAPILASCNENTGEAQAQTQSAPEVTVQAVSARPAPLTDGSRC